LWNQKLKTVASQNSIDALTLIFIELQISTEFDTEDMVIKISPLILEKRKLGL
jgi:hypothetical protein